MKFVKRKFEAKIEIWENAAQQLTGRSYSVNSWIAVILLLMPVK
jgi:hypothetical protein